MASILGVRVFRNILIPSVRMTLTMSKMFARIICQTIEWEVNYSTAKKEEVILASIFYFTFVRRFIQFFASAGIRPVVNRLNQDTIVYYGLVFCAFSWSYIVKWHNGRMIMVFIRVIRVQIINALLIKSVIAAEKIMKNLVRYFNIFLFFAMYGTHFIPVFWTTRLWWSWFLRPLCRPLWRKINVKLSNM